MELCSLGFGRLSRSAKQAFPMCGAHSQHTTIRECFLLSRPSDMRTSGRSAKRVMHKCLLHFADDLNAGRNTEEEQAQAQNSFDWSLMNSSRLDSFES